MATAHKSRVLDMTQGDPFRLVLQFSMPLFCSNLLQQLYNLTDTALAGHLLGSAALAEIGATAALYGLIMNFAFGMNNGLALTVSRYFGAGDESGIRRAVGWMVTLSAAVSLVLTGCSLLGRDALLTVLQVPAQAWGGASAYLTVILLGIPLTMLYNMEAALLRAVGNSMTPLLASGLELVGKVIFAIWLVPVRGYRAVCFCEPTTWVVCFVFILLAVWRCRGDLRDAEKI